MRRFPNTTAQSQARRRTFLLDSGGRFPDRLRVMFPRISARTAASQPGRAGERFRQTSQHGIRIMDS